LYCGIFFTESGWVWIGDGGDAGGSVGGSGNGGPTSSPTVSPTPQPDEVPLDECNQASDPKCHVPLTAADLSNLDASYQYLRDTLGVWADTVAKRQCLELFRGLNRLRTLGSPKGVWRGRDSIPNPATAPVHFSQAYQGSDRFHFDPPILDNATKISGRKLLLVSALHETAHAMGIADHGQINPDDPSAGYTGLPYFMYTDIPGPNSCVYQ
ncbi:MAG: hypothetical protein SFU57_13230, partial [Gemmatimonadales bacterium]|nr:hypothetical protein [Gemmatimonadales bacterium]